MIKIKTIDGKVLYTAEDASDVRKALEAAVSGGANLRGAYLRGANLEGANLRGANLGGANLEGAYLEGANLRGANLGGANLEGANLGGAYLRGANLEGAYLGGAYLRGANLEGANLRGANLRGANLGGANLRGANLGGAYLDPETWSQVATKLEEAIAAMNDGGRHWIKGSLTRELEDGSQAYCSIGSIESHTQNAETVRALALWLLASVAGGEIATFNDNKSTTWEDVQTVFAVAIKHARRFGDGA